MGLLDEIRKEAKNYIKIFDAIELIATEENTPIFEVVIYLLNKRIDENVCVYAKTLNENIEYIDDSYGGTYPKTWRALATIRDTFKEEDPKGTNFEHSWLYPKLNEFTGYYWNKSVFFDFEPIKMLGLEIIEDENFKESEPNTDNLNAEITQLKDQLAQAQQRIQELEAMSNIQDSDSDAQITGIYRRNLLAKDRQGMARIIALNLWNDDQNILIGDMANRIYAIMVDFCKDDLPQETSSLKTWLRPIAPP